MRCDGRNGKQQHGGDLMQWLRIAVLPGRIEKSQRRKCALMKSNLLDWREKEKKVVATKIMMLLSTIWQIELRFNLKSTRVQFEAIRSQIGFYPLELHSGLNRIQLGFDLPTTYTLLPTPYYWRPSSCCLLVVTCYAYLLPAPYCLLPTT